MPKKFLVSFLKVVGYIIFLVVLIFLGQFLFRYLYYIIDNTGGGWIGSDQVWSLVFGQIFSYFFFSIFLIVTFCYNKFIKLSFLGVIFLVNLFFLVSVFGFKNSSLIILFVVLSLLGYLLAELLKFSYNKIKNH